MESEGVDILKDAFNTSINIEFLRFGLRSKHMRDLFLLDFVAFIILEEEVPALWRLHIVHKCTLLVNFLIYLFLLLCAVLLALTSSMQVLIDHLLDFTQLFPLKSLKKNVVLDVL